MNLLSIAAPFATGGVFTAAEGEAAGGGLAINFFWILVAAGNFILFAVILYLAFGKQVSGMLAARRERIEQGIRDAEQARRDRESAETERIAALTEARREANEILARAQKVAQETRDADLALQAAGRVVRETMTDQRQRRLVEEFLEEAAPSSGR